MRGYMEVELDRRRREWVCVLCGGDGTYMLNTCKRCGGSGLEPPKVFVVPDRYMVGRGDESEDVDTEPLSVSELNQDGIRWGLEGDVDV